MAKKVEVDERVIAIQTQMDNKVTEINEIEQQKAEFEALYEAKMQELKEQYTNRIEKLDSRKNMLLAEIRTLFNEVPHKATKTQEKVSLLAGEVVLKLPTKKIDYDKVKLLEWAKAAGENDLINTKIIEEFKWADFKSKLTIDDGKIINAETGEIINIEGLGILEVAEELTIK